MLLIFGIDQLGVQHELEINVQHSGVIFRAFGISTQPKKGVGYSA
jgi:hypothetical protein